MLESVTDDMLVDLYGGPDVNMTDLLNSGINEIEVRFTEFECTYTPVTFIGCNDPVYTHLESGFLNVRLYYSMYHKCMTWWQSHIKSWPGAYFTKGLKPDFGLKFKTLVVNSGKNVLSQRA